MPFFMPFFVPFFMLHFGIYDGVSCFTSSLLSKLTFSGVPTYRITRRMFLRIVHKLIKFLLPWSWAGFPPARADSNDLPPRPVFRVRHLCYFVPFQRPYFVPFQRPYFVPYFVCVTFAISSQKGCLVKWAWQTFYNWSFLVPNFSHKKMK